MTQSEAALREGVSRNTAYRLEHGDAGVAIGQIVRYLDAITPGATLLDLLTAKQPELLLLEVRERRHRVRGMSKTELESPDF